MEWNRGINYITMERNRASITSQWNGIGATITSSGMKTRQIVMTSPVDRGEREKRKKLQSQSTKNNYLSIIGQPFEHNFRMGHKFVRGNIPCFILQKLGVAINQRGQILYGINKATGTATDLAW